MACAHRGDERIVGIDDRVLGRLQQFLFELGVELERAVSIEVIGRHVEHRRRERRQAVRRLHLEARDLEHVGVGFVASSKSSAGGPRLPPAGARSRCDSSIFDANVVTVLLPLLPVTAITGARTASANSSMSPMTARPRRRASTASGKSYGQPRRQQHAARVVEPALVERLERRRRRRARAARSSCKPRRIGAAVDDAHALAARRQVARDRRARRAEPDDETVFRRGFAHRRFLSF